MTIEISETDDLQACLTLRHQVFVQEQGVPSALEQDELDAVAIHFLAFDDGVPVGTARLLINGAVGKIGRVCVLPSSRGAGLGAGLTRAAMDHLRQMPGVTTARLGAQTHALGFYERLGFTAVGLQYMDAGIPHFDMECPV